jgi:hypothetical protein
LRTTLTAPRPVCNNSRVFRLLRLATLLVAAWGCDERRTPAPVPTSSAEPSAAFRYDPDWKGSEAPLPREAVLETSAGVIRCELFDEADGGPRRRLAALARGEAPYRTREGWRKRRAYDGAPFDRAAPGLFVVVRPLGAIVAPGEPVAGVRRPHDEAGLLSIGPEGELALSAAPAPSLDRAMTPIGRCTPLDGIDALTRTPAEFGRPIEPPRVDRLLVRP